MGREHAHNRPATNFSIIFCVSVVLVRLVVFQVYSGREYPTAPRQAARCRCMSVRFPLTCRREDRHGHTASKRGSISVSSFVQPAASTPCACLLPARAVARQRVLFEGGRPPCHGSTQSIAMADTRPLREPGMHGRSKDGRGHYCLPAGDNAVDDPEGDIGPSITTATGCRAHPAWSSLLCCRLRCTQ